MKKTLMSLIALAFAAGLTAPTFAAKHEMDLAAACKGKKAGDAVKVDGKDMKCPEAKKDEKKK
ncbi:MAG: hypothetical protein ACLGHO_12555 [Gammaproteobacteria bacterium]